VNDKNQCLLCDISPTDSYKLWGTGYVLLFKTETSAICFTYLTLRHISHTTEFSRVYRRSDGRWEPAALANLKEVFR